MALEVTPVNRNLHTRVTFMALEFEDLFVVLGLAALMNIVSRFVGGVTGAVLQYGVPLGVVPLLIAFKYGKPRGYLRDMLTWHTKPRAYCALAHDPADEDELHRGGEVNARDHGTTRKEAR